MPIAQKTVHLKLLQNTNRKPHAGTGTVPLLAWGLVSVAVSGQNNNKAVAGAALEAVAIWLHHRNAPCRTAFGRVCRFAARYLVVVAGI